MYHFIYDTVNNVNNKVYRGAHSSVNIDDDYLGSGKALRQAIAKHGRDKFTRTIVAFAECRESLFALEEQLVDREWCARPDTYNLKPGGKGVPKGSSHHLYNKRPNEEAIEKQRTAIKKTLAERSWSQAGENNPNYGRKYSEEVRAKISAAHKGRKSSPEAVAKMKETKRLQREERERLGIKLPARMVMTDEVKRKISETKKARSLLKKMGNV